MLTIGGVQAFRKPENWRVKPDIRAERVQTDNGFVVQHSGEHGNIITCIAVFAATVWPTVKGYADAGTVVNVTDHVGTEYSGCTVVVDDFGYIDKHEKFISASLTIWTGG